MRSIGYAALAAVLLSLGAPRAGNADVLVLHGSKAETVAPLRRAGPPVVVRGETAALHREAAERERRPAKHRRTVVAGRTLWVIGEDGLPIKACRLLYTEYEGVDLITCSRQLVLVR